MNVYDHFKQPHNVGTLKKALKATVKNSLCGDELTLYLKINKKVEDAKFTANACMLCQASASLLTDYVKSLSVGKLKKIDDKTIFKLLGFVPTPSRTGCALLSLKALKKITQT
ncbi:MAG: iron-sulfur cluster assembly scaffold protein [Candidatus Marsarchaeota archaeon]|nr:iron-sulfur cluster assembly scaffold protein [Candidatus Marsarchaeota archaeon]